jgi:ribosomal protein L40E
MIFEQKNSATGADSMNSHSIQQPEKKIKCKNCGRELDPEELREKQELVDFEGSFRKYSVCGYCESDEIAEATRCRGCSYLILDYEDETDGFCTACTCEIAERFKRLIDQNFYESEQEVLYTLFGLDMVRD